MSKQKYIDIFLISSDNRFLLNLIDRKPLYVLVFYTFVLDYL